MVVVRSSARYRRHVSKVARPHGATRRCSGKHFIFSRLATLSKPSLPRYRTGPPSPDRRPGSQACRETSRYGSLALCDVFYGCGKGGEGGAPHTDPLGPRVICHQSARKAPREHAVPPVVPRAELRYSICIRGYGDEINKKRVGGEKRSEELNKRALLFLLSNAAFKYKYTSLIRIQNHV
jgi:hypothetical protein